MSHYAGFDFLMIRPPTSRIVGEKQGGKESHKKEIRRQQEVDVHKEEGVKRAVKESMNIGKLLGLVSVEN